VRKRSDVISPSVRVEQTIPKIEESSVPCGFVWRGSLSIVRKCEDVAVTENRLERSSFYEFLQAQAVSMESDPGRLQRNAVQDLYIRKLPGRIPERSAVGQSMQVPRKNIFLQSACCLHEDR